ncbi:GMC family oxidoreductase N-terminal domain-containing protein [Paenibacillus sp. P26]|nr:GMC family oxidoreductase N-terminal domain-containing protein [Paenibacillus sp. P26]
MAKELGELGLKVLVLEAGPWYGNKQWPDPNRDRGGTASSNPGDLDIVLFKEIYNKQENMMNNLISGRIRWGPADSARPPWPRILAQKGYVWQNSGVGGTTQHYLAHSPRAFPRAVDHVWPIPYRELVPYYEKVEATLPVEFAPVTAKEELFYYGARKEGWQLIPTLDVVRPGFRPQPNAILPPNKELMNPEYSLEQLSWMEGCTLAGHCINGRPHGPSVDKIAKRSTHVSYIPMALKTGNVEIRPNAFTVRILTARDPKEGLRAVGVRFRDTWTGEMQEVQAGAVVMAAGCIETPRLWLNSDLPRDPWVGRGLVNHFFDSITGIFGPEELISILGQPESGPYVGHTSGARLDYPGIGCLEVAGMGPGLTATMNFSNSAAGFSFLHPPSPGALWNGYGLIAGPELTDIMENFSRTLNIVVYADDDVTPSNGITVVPDKTDEHGPIPKVSYTPSLRARNNRETLIRIAAGILRSAGLAEFTGPAGRRDL